MNRKEKLVTRLEERCRIYEDSPNIQATYIDLLRLTEDVIKIINIDKNIGFNNEKSVR